MPRSTYLATAPMPWIDGFITWSKTEVTQKVYIACLLTRCCTVDYIQVRCCRRYRESGDFCPSHVGAEPDQEVTTKVAVSYPAQLTLSL